MSVATWDLTEPAAAAPHAYRVAGGSPLSATFRRLAGGLSEGVDLLEVSNGAASIAVVPTRGMSVWKASCGDVALGWQSPVAGPVHPQWVNLADPSGLGWLDGFDELLVRCGLLSNGAPEFDDDGRLRYPLHGRIANRPARSLELRIDEAAGEISVTGVVDETRFLQHDLRLTSTLATRTGEKGFRLRDTVENRAGTPIDMQLLYHINFGAPVLTAGGRFVAPVRSVAPRDPRAAEGMSTWDRYGPPQGGYAEQVYFCELAGDASGATETLLVDAHETRAARVAFSLASLPCFTLWKNTAADADGYVTGLEPGVNFPNRRSFEQRRGRTVPLPPGGAYACELEVHLLEGRDEVAAALARVAALQQGVVPHVHPQPRPDWSA